VVREVVCPVVTGVRFDQPQDSGVLTSAFSPVGNEITGVKKLCDVIVFAGFQRL
jgi:hypothetical protein